MAIKLYRILGICWGAISGFLSFLCLIISGSKAGPDRYITFYGLLSVVGLVASVFLLSGVTWARVTLLFIAIISASSCGLVIASAPGLSAPVLTFLASVGAYSLVSIVLLLIPKKYIT